MAATSVGVIVAVVGLGTLATAITAMEVGPDTVADAAIRTISFSPWGAVMLWAALSIRKGVNTLGTKWDEFLLLLKVNADSLKALSDAQKEQTAVERENLRFKTDPQIETPRRSPKSPR